MVSKSSGKPRGLGIAQLALIATAIAIALYFAQAPERIDRGPTAVSGSAVPSVRVIKPERTEEYQQLFDLTGSIVLEKKVVVVSEVAGRVVWVSPHFVNGGSIRAGEIFVEIDPREFELAVRSAKEGVVAAEAALPIAENNSTSECGHLEQADMAMADREKRQAECNAVIIKAKAHLGNAQVALELAELQLSRTKIKLPFDVRVITTELEVGDFVGPPDVAGRLSALGVVFRLEAIRAQAPIEAKTIAALDPVIGRRTTVQTEIGTFEAEVAHIAAVATPETRLFRVFFKFSAAIPKETLPAAGMFAEMQIFGPKLKGVFVLPEAVAREHDHVWVVMDATLQRVTPVHVGRTSDGWIVEAFDAGDGVVVGPLPGAREGMQIEVQRPQSSQ